MSSLAHVQQPNHWTKTLPLANAVRIERAKIKRHVSAAPTTLESRQRLVVALEERQHDRCIAGAKVLEMLMAVRRFGPDTCTHLMAVRLGVRSNKRVQDLTERQFALLCEILRGEE